ncbi:FAD-dependent oxidoreductase [Streptomyces sp. NPDC091271]|uniref:FAD-dependent oxidoreductase n=1 Tax=Streptomyces sp. NPDC091271 TaxID=3365980 RepID=UPI0037F6FFD4
MNVRPAVDDILIIGGGIAGLAAAVALRAAGAAVDVVERDDRPEGASIGLTGRAVDALDELGLLEDCAARGNVLHGTVFDRMYDAEGTPLPVPPMPPPPGGTGRPGAVVIHRAELADILRTHALRAGARLRTRTTVTALERHPAHVNVTFTDGSEGVYGLVVGADGVGSWTRGQIHEDLEPQYTGHMSLRWLVPDVSDSRPGFYHGPQGTVIFGLLPPRTVYVSTGCDHPRTHVGDEEARALLRGRLAQYKAPFVREIAERLTDDAIVLARPYEWILVPQPWHRGRVTLIGDAAHATTAHLSSGGGMALEDAAVLGQEIARAATVAEALDRFAARRADRVRNVVETSVELMRMEREHAGPRAMGKVRGEALGALSAPY